MKKVILSSVLAAAAIATVGSANAATTAQVFCSGASGNGATASVTSATEFVKVAFTPKCSINVHLAGSDATTYYRVGAASSKGKTMFAGSSNGGGVSAAGLCAASTGCVAGEAQSAITSGATS